MNRWCLHIVALAMMIALPQLSWAQSQKTGESFALAKDRAKMLKSLLPGTRDYFYYHCLHYQHTGQLNKAEKILDAWAKRFNKYGTWREMRHRQALLRYRTQPKKSVAYLKRVLGLSFNHRRTQAGAKSKLPTVFDNAKIGPAALIPRAMRYSRYSLFGFEDSYLRKLANMPLNKRRRYQLLQRLLLPDLPNVLDLILADLKAYKNRRFGSISIHNALTLSQLRALAKRAPELAKSRGYVNAYLTRLQPRAGLDWRSDRKVRAQYLARLWAFAKNLGLAYTSLKRNITYHQLRLDQETGKYDQARLIRYLRFPRYAVYMNSRYVRRILQNRGRTYGAMTSTTGLPSIGNDQKLVRALLIHFLAKASSYRRYLPFLRASYLKVLMAEAKLLKGVGRAASWVKLLSPAQYRALQKRIELKFVPTNKESFGSDEAVALKVAVKNVKNLIVKVYEINAFNYYRRMKREVPATINLDGLVANQEQRFRYNTPSIRRVVRSFTFPKLSKRGVYVIEFIGNGKSSRAMIRKGQLQALVRSSAAGHIFTVLNEAGKVVKNATIWLGQRKFKSDKDGEIAIPYSHRPGTKKVILGDGRFVSLASFYHQREKYRLHAYFHVEQEDLLRRNVAKILVKAELRSHRYLASLRLLEDVTLTLTATDRYGVKTTQKVPNFKLSLNKEAVHKFRVPEALVRLELSLSAKVKHVSRPNHKQTLSAHYTFRTNTLERGSAFKGMHLRRSDSGYVLELRGRTGEPLAGQRVSLSFKHADFRSRISATLQSNRYGVVGLGALKRISNLRASLSGSGTRSWLLLAEHSDIPSTLTGRAGEMIRIPALGLAARSWRTQVSLFELRGRQYYKEHTSALELRDGLLEIKELPAGDYRMVVRLPTGKKTIYLHIEEGPVVSRHVMGAHRLVGLSRVSIPSMRQANTSKKQIVLRVDGASSMTRVHVIATRYVPRFDAMARLGRVVTTPSSIRTLDKLLSSYREGRQLSDEYRYILERRYAKRFAGNMLMQPSLLLNPWEIAKTSTGTSRGGKGYGYGAGNRGYGRYGRAKRRMAYKKSRTAFGAGLIPSLDFLPESAVVLANLRPDAKGKIVIERSKLKDKQHVFVLMLSPGVALAQEVMLPAKALKPVDLRLRQGLNIKKHYAQRQQISVLPAKGVFSVKDVSSAKVTVYDSLAKIYRLLATLRKNDSKFAAFSFLLKWPSFKRAKKLALYNKFASHELHFFLYHKDRAFFEKVVKPYLANKKHKTFMDHWLLGASLKPYLSMWQYQQLNTVERILLAQRVKGEAAQTLRHLREQVMLRRLSTGRLGYLFQSGLSTDALEGNKKVKIYDRLRRRRTFFDFDAKTVSGALAKPKEEATEASAPRPAPSSASPKESDDASDTERKKDARMRDQMIRFYRSPGKTKTWAEMHYYKVQLAQQSAALVKPNAFWVDYAAHRGKSAFLSRHVAQATGSTTEALLALAVLELPMQAKGTKRTYKGNAMTIKVQRPALIFHQQIAEISAKAKPSPILVSQQVFRQGDRYRYVKGERRDKFITDEFLAQQVYGAQVVITNPTSSTQKLQLLWQIPRGAMPVRNGKVTESRQLRLRAYQTRRLTFYFYFPVVGSFKQFPAHLTRGGKSLVAFAKTQRFKVVRQLSKVDTESWAHVSQAGSLKQVLSYLRRHNLQRTNLAQIAWRMRRKGAFQGIVRLLRQHHTYNSTLWSYGFFHGDKQTMRDYLMHNQSFVRRCGAYLKSPLLDIDLVARRQFQHLEFRPLINERVHAFKGRFQILNQGFRSHVASLMRVLRYRPTLSAQDRMELTYVFLVKGQIEEAIAMFAAVERKKVATKMQYDYFKAYLDFYNDKPTVAASIAARYKDHPVPRWRKRFRAILTTLAEIEGKGKAFVGDKSKASQQQLAQQEASFDFKIRDKQLALSFRNVKSFTVRYYLMDIELLFSRSPFGSRQSGRFSYIKPNATQQIKAPAKGNKLVVSLPKRFSQQNVMIEVEADGKRKSQTYYANALDVQVSENYGQVQVALEGKTRGLAKVYVKVYAKLQNGHVQFYKDGYTDLRGRFDYASRNGGPLNRVKRFALLIMSDKYGAVVREVTPPRQ